MDAAVAAEVVAVVSACLDNVRVHVGEDAPAWVLLESFGRPGRGVGARRGAGHRRRAGSPRPRPRAASGVSQSIRGRIADLGGEAALTTGSFGTEWELVVPR